MNLRKKLIEVALPLEAIDEATVMEGAGPAHPAAACGSNCGASCVICEFAELIDRDGCKHDK